MSFRTVVSNIIERADSDTNNIIGLIDNYNSVDLAVNNFNQSRNLEIIIVDNNYQVLKTTASTLRTQYFSNNITYAKLEGSAYSFIKKDIGRALSLVYSKRGSLENEIIVISIEYPFYMYNEFKQILLTIIIISILLIFVDTYLIASIYINSYIWDLNKFVKNNNIYNSIDYHNMEFSSPSDNSEVIRLIETLNSFKKQYDSILDNDKKRFSTINSFLSNIPTGIMIIDSNKDITLMNERVNFLLNIRKREIINSKSIKGLDRIYKIRDLVVKDNKIRIEDIIISDKIIEIEAMPLLDKYSPYELIGVLFLFRDVTEMREISMIREDFVSNVSHELRTPLTIISGFSQALLNREIEEEDKKICIDSINNEVKKLTNLTNELLQISQVENSEIKNKKEIFNPFEIVKQQVALFLNKAVEKNINIQISNDTNDQCDLFSNIIYFRQIINNLIDNAIKYSPINTDILINEYLSNEYYIFSIKDEGFGIDKKDQDKIFDRFYRVEKSRNSEIAGSGLGLSIVKLFLEAIGGEINVSSEIGRGSTFIVKIKRK
ncbi:MAG: hypothetical protein EOL97_02925 [Spirochaetia bacterium]|nr:hypothetical protein [Spirochaetia bacterium]